MFCKSSMLFHTISRPGFLSIGSLAALRTAGESPGRVRALIIIIMTMILHTNPLAPFNSSTINNGFTSMQLLPFRQRPLNHPLRLKNLIR